MAADNGMRPIAEVRRPRDATTWELALLPVAMASLSLLMWFSLPSFHTALESMRGQIDERLSVIARMAEDVGSGHIEHSGCVAPLVPPPVFVEDDATATNAELIDAGRLRELGIETQLVSDFELSLQGQLSFVLYWSKHPPITTQRMVRKRIARELEQPLSHPYVVLYGARVIAQADEVPTAVLVSAFLFDASSGRRLCQFSFVEPSPIDGAAGGGSLWSRVRERLVQELGNVTRSESALVD